MPELSRTLASSEHRPPGSLEAGRNLSRACGHARIAAFVCEETERLARQVGFPLAVIAATGDPTRHAAHLSRTLHAAWAPKAYDSWPMPFDDGLALPKHLSYRQFAFDARWLGTAPMPDGLTLEAGAILVALPHGTSATDFSAVMATGLSDLSYENVARRPDQVRYRYLTGRPVVISPRYALVTPGDIERIASVDDLFKFHPGDFVTVVKAVALALDVLTVGSVMARIEAHNIDARELSNE